MDIFKKMSIKMRGLNMWVLLLGIIGIAFLDAGLSQCSFKKRAKKVHYISLAEDLPAVKSGDTLYLDNYGDTISIDFHSDDPSATPYIVTPN